MAVAIANGQSPPLELLEHIYRKMYHLSYREMMEEPSDKFFLNLRIEALIKEQEERIMRHGNS